ncbi:hypothetical protein [Spiroplasma alleghenense]|uniref:Uncharacterized protein n=1 Tax=Spiroplasma alleghenense TaxID=216931 RepID=A0A345Z440_9MOLU|nr:hypothetical protein [Spiroplasma alleghenense]AXK51369.1 hypothetical protein SALLE_v1c06990 [Spiroplasma alleghenense]
MKVLLPILLSSGLVVQPVANINLSQEKVDNRSTDAEIFRNNIDQLNAISKEELKETLYSLGDKTLFNTSKLEALMKNKEVTGITEIISYFKDFSFETKILDSSLNKMFDKDINGKSMQFWKFKAISFWYTWISGYWIANFNDEFSKDIAGGSSITSDNTGIFSDATGGIPILSGVASGLSAVLYGISEIFEKNNQGNGVYINFLTLVPVGWGPSTENWN